VNDDLVKDHHASVEQTAPFWEQVKGQRLFITGGTGFFGTWLLGTFMHANRSLNLRAQAVVLSRNPDGFRQALPGIASDEAIHLVKGDVRTFDFPTGEFSHIIHAATDASAAINDGRPLEMVDTIVEGTRRVLDFAVYSGTKRLLLTSSGAVYGRQPPTLSHIPEEHQGGPDMQLHTSAYGEGKRLAELLCTLYARSHGLEPTIARCFAFVGPYLPFTAHYAVGNFLADVLQQRPIVIKGDGTPKRSYLYAADMVVWLLTILARGQSCRPYNVGSNAAVNIAELAYHAAALRQPVMAVSVLGKAEPGQLPEQYVPATDRAQAELGLQVRVELDDALRRTLAWAQANPSLALRSR